MGKGQLTIFSELTFGDTKDDISKIVRKFAGMDKPRYLRAIRSAMILSRKRDGIDRITDAPTTATPANALIIAALLALIFWRRAW